MINIFISYRREDSAGWTLALSKSLSDVFGQEHVFRDIDTLHPGVDYVDEIESYLNHCHVFLSIIGPRWMSIVDGKDRLRINDPDDLVRVETSKALKRKILAIPTLVGNASIPAADDLP